MFEAFVASGNLAHSLGGARQIVLLRVPFHGVHTLQQRALPTTKSGKGNLESLLSNSYACSAGSSGSVGSAGSFGSIGWVGSFVSVGSNRSIGSVGSIGSVESSPTSDPPALGRLAGRPAGRSERILCNKTCSNVYESTIHRNGGPMLGMERSASSFLF